MTAYGTPNLADERLLTEWNADWQLWQRNILTVSMPQGLPVSLELSNFSKQFSCTQWRFLPPVQIVELADIDFIRRKVAYDRGM